MTTTMTVFKIAEARAILVEYKVRLDALLRASTMEDYNSGRFHRIKAELLSYALGRLKKIFP